LIRPGTSCAGIEELQEGRLVRGAGEGGGMALVEAEAGEGGDLPEQLFRLVGGQAAAVDAAVDKASVELLHLLDERQVPIALRKPSDSAALKPATSMAIFITCSW
jgi:hypothetical protein